MTLGNRRSPELAEVIKSALNDHTDGLHFAIPGKIESYDPIMQKANVKPLLKRKVIGRDATEFVEELPVVPEVPVAFPRGGGFFLSFPLEKGDLVLLIVVDRSIDAYTYSTGAVDTDPEDVRAHDLSDAVALPCFYPFTRALKCEVTSGAVFGSETGAQVRAKKDAVEVTSNGLPAVIPPITIPPIPGKGFVAMAAKLAALFNVHTHSVSGAVTGPPATLWTEANVSSSNLKANG